MPKPRDRAGSSRGNDGLDLELSQKSSQTAAKGSLEMACLGRSFSLGTLYDCRTDSILSGLGLWKQTSLLEHVKTKLQPWSFGQILSENNVQRKVDALKVSADLKLSLVFGLITVSGAADYVKDKTSSKHQCRLTLNYQCTSRKEELAMEHLMNLDFEEEMGAISSEPTHVVTAVLYGANAFMVFDSQHDNEEEKQEVEGMLDLVIKKFVDISGIGDLKLTDEEKSLADSLKCTFHGDFQPEMNPTTYQEAMNVWRNLPQFLNSDKHVPIRVWLHPINKLCNKKKTKVSKLRLSISVGLIDDAVERIERADSCVALANDLLRTSSFRTFSELARKARKFLDSISKFNSLIQQKLQQLLPAIKSGNKDEQKLFDLMNAWDASPFALSRLENWVRDYQALDVLITEYLKTFRKQGSNIEEALKHGSVQAAMLDPRFEYLIVYFFHFNSEDEQLSAMNTTVARRELKDNLSAETGHSLQVYKGASDSMLSPTRCFVTFAKNNADNDRLKFLFAEYLEACAATSCSICVYKNGKMVEKDYCPPSEPGEPQIELEDGTVIVYWEPPEYGQEKIDHYKVLFSNDNWGREEKCTKACSIEFRGLSKNKMTYKVKVEAWGKYGDKTCSVETSGSLTKADGQSLPGKPTAQKFSTSDYFQYVIAWEGQQEATVVYEIQTEENGIWNEKTSKTSESESSVKLRLKPGTKYRFRVRKETGKQYFKGKWSPISDVLVVPSLKESLAMKKRESLRQDMEHEVESSS